MDYVALKAEIQADPNCNSAVSAKDCNSVAAIRSAVRKAVKPVSAATTLTWAASGPLSRIVDASINTSSPARSSCLAFLHSLYSGMDIGLNDPGVLPAFQGWVAVGIITQVEYDNLFARATVLDPVSAYDCGFALFNPDGTPK